MQFRVIIFEPEECIIQDIDISDPDNFHQRKRYPFAIKSFLGDPDQFIYAKGSDLLVFDLITQAVLVRWQGCYSKSRVIPFHTKPYVLFCDTNHNLILYNSSKAKVQQNYGYDSSPDLVEGWPMNFESHSFGYFLSPYETKIVIFNRGTIDILDLYSGQLLYQIELEFSNFSSEFESLRCKISPDENYIAFFGSNLNVYDFQTGSLVFKNTEVGGTSAMHFTLDSQQLIIASGSNLKFVSCDTGAVVKLVKLSEMDRHLSRDAGKFDQV